jgi:hypothetical protein
MAAAVAALLLLPAPRRWWVGGLCTGLLVLCRDIYLPLAVFAAGLWLWLGAGALKERARDVAMLLAAMAVVVLPWTARNFAVLGRPVPVSAGRLGFSLWLGTWALDGSFTAGDVTGTRVYPPEATRNAEERAMLDEATAKGVAPARADELFRALAMARLKTEPLSVLGRSILRAPRLWLGTRFDIFTLNERALPYGSLAWRIVKSTLWGFNFVMLALGLAGGALLLKRRSPLAWVLVPLVFTGAVYFPLNSFENRYSQPVLGLLFLLGAVAASELWALRARAAQTSRASP